MSVMKLGLCLSNAPSSHPAGLDSSPRLCHKLYVDPWSNSWCDISALIIPVANQPPRKERACERERERERAMKLSRVPNTHILRADCRYDRYCECHNNQLFSLSLFPKIEYTPPPPRGNGVSAA